MGSEDRRDAEPWPGLSFGAAGGPRAPVARRVSWLGWSYRRIREKSLRQLTRAALLRVWPLSILVRLFYRVRLGDSWWRARNRVARSRFEHAETQLDPAQKQAVQDLATEGVHVTTLAELLREEGRLPVLQEEAASLLRTPGLERQIDLRCSTGSKTYLVRAIGWRPAREVPTQLAALFLEERMLDVVNGYLGLWSRVVYLDLWYSLPVSKADAKIVTSETWHRDQEDRSLVKVLVYLDDVDETMGPSSYMLETQPGGRHGHMCPPSPPDARLPRDAIKRLPPVIRTRSFTGRAGTVILFDSCGLHSGGLSNTRPRIALVATYGSDAAIEGRRYELADPDQPETLGPAARYAIRLPD